MCFAKFFQTKEMYFFIGKLNFKSALWAFIALVPFWLNNAKGQGVYHSKVWSPDLGNGYYKNPIIFADYSDPDAIRVGDDYYLVASSFDAIPGLPILHSKDLINWSIVSHALLKQPPYDVFDKPQHGNGAWAPSIRYHNKEFYIYYPDPDFGIYMVKSKSIKGTWSKPLLVEKGKGIIDPCPFWDDNGKAYLVHAFAGSRAGIKSILVIQEMNKEGTRIINDGQIVYDGHQHDPTVEGPKLYKRNGYYYIFAPAGGVPTGWQLVLRSKNIYGPYQRRIVMDQGSTNINGPHQGAWVTTQTGENWFIHFQDRGIYGRVTCLEPMNWINDWPVIGVDKDGDGKGEPVETFKKPNVGKLYPVNNPQESDEFNSSKLGIQWQWQANAKPYWYFMDSAMGCIRLYSFQNTDSSSVNNLWNTPNLLLQKFPAESFQIDTKVTFHPNPDIQNEKAGIVIMGMSYADLAIQSKTGGNYLVYTTCINAVDNLPEKEKEIKKLNNNTIYLRVKVFKGGTCSFGYSEDGSKFQYLPEKFQAVLGKWIGAKMGLFCTRDSKINDSGYMDVDYFRINKLSN